MLALYQGQVYLSGGERALMRLAPKRDAPATPVPHVPRASAAVAVHKVPLLLFSTLGPSPEPVFVTYICQSL